MVRQKFPAAARQVVEDDDLVTALDQAVDHVGPDEARSTRHQPTHATPEEGLHSSFRWRHGLQDARG